MGSPGTDGWADLGEGTATPPGRARPVPLIFVVFGAGGVGKGTVVSRLLRLSDRLWLSRSWTTRQRRPSEAEDAYAFVDRDRFMGRIGSDGFVEWTEFAGNGHLYGTPTMEPPQGADVVLEIDSQGAIQVKERYPEAVLIFIAAPSREAQERRLRLRGDDEASIHKRLAIAADEEKLGRDIADFVVVNDDLERASKELAGIVEACREGFGRQGIATTRQEQGLNG
jgi:guanylate kinase